MSQHVSSTTAFAPGTSSAAPRAARSVPRLLAGTVLCVGAVALVTAQAAFRDTEAQLAAHALHLALGLPAWAGHAQPILYFTYPAGHTRHGLGLEVTLGCSSVLILAPALMLLGLFTITGRTHPLRMAVAASTVAAILITANVVRQAMIAAMVAHWGPQNGFGWGHSVFGSLIILAGMALAGFACYVTLRQPKRGSVSARAC